jgi:hypothetical protein
MAEKQEADELEYEGHPIIEYAIVVNKLGDGLSDAVSIDPVIIQPNDIAHLAVRVRKTKDRYDFIRDKKTNKILGVRWVQIFDSTGATFADGPTIKKAVQATVDKIEKARADAKGQLTLVVGGDDDDTPTRDRHPDLAAGVDDATKGVE